MTMRLAFAVATAVLPDVVILDEALAEGDGLRVAPKAKRQFSSARIPG